MLIMATKLGIDFGTTHTVVAVVDRGNYPIVSFHNETGEVLDWYPSMAAVRQGEWRFGLDALAVADREDWFVLRSFKRILTGCSPGHRVQTIEGETTIIELLGGFLQALLRDLRQRSNIDLSLESHPEVMISVPANANNIQRFLTTEAFKLAGFKVLGMVNEPTAAGIEYVHRFGVRGSRSRKHYLMVFDLGGGTFDVSLIGIGPHQYETLAAEGVMRLGGDDFDQILFEQVLAHAQIDVTTLNHAQKTALLEECRLKKESLHPNTRRVFIDLASIVAGQENVELSVADYYAACDDLVQQTLQVVASVLESAAQRHALEEADIASLYIVGGASRFPLVGKRLREAYQRLVKRSAYPHGAVAVGLAIAAEQANTLELREQFARDFGVWREGDAGKEVVLDRLFSRGTSLPPRGEPPLTITRSYQPTHNIGCFRYLECGRVNEAGKPGDDLTVLKEVRFPFDHCLQGQSDLDGVTIDTMPATGVSTIEEIYRCTPEGMVELTIRDTGTGFEQRYLLIGA